MNDGPPPGEWLLALLLLGLVVGALIIVNVLTDGELYRWGMP